MSRVHWRDTGYNRIMTGLRELTQYVVRVGVINEHATRIHPLRSRMTVGDVARIQEFGSSRANIPARSFLRSAVHEHASEVIDGIAEAVRGVLNGSSSWAGLFNMGEKFTRYVKDRVLAGNIPPPLAEYTVQKKGHGKTLQDTMVLSESISHETVPRKLANDGGFEDF